MRIFSKLKTVLRRIDERQQQPGYALTTSTEEHVCPHCATEYVGRFCPQCGMKYDTVHFTQGNIVRMVLDVLGYDETGSHSILRTLRDLFWRPGYMVRDYLNGHSVAYFQPFKLLVFLSVVFSLLIYLMGVEHETQPVELVKGFNDVISEGGRDGELFRRLLPLAEVYERAANFLRSDVIYRIIFRNGFVVTAIWVVYRRRARYTWSETFMAQMFFCCQFLLLAMAQLLLTGVYQSDGEFPYFVADEVVPLVMLYDYFQLYGERRFWPALWRLVAIVLLLLLQDTISYILIVLSFIGYGAVVM